MAAKKRGDFLSQAKAAGQRERVEVPGMDMDVYAVTLTRGEVRRITEACLAKGKDLSDVDAVDNEKLASMLVAASICGSNGERLIPEGRESELDDLPNPIQLALQAAALKVNGMAGQEGNADS